MSVGGSAFDSWTTTSELEGTIFFQRRMNLPGWRQMAPSASAHVVQRSTDPEHYTRVDNALIESFWSTMQREILDRSTWTSRKELASAMSE